MPYLDDGDVTLYQGDAAQVLATLPERSVDCCVTSPPYYGMRDYGSEGQIGLEETPDAYVERIVGVFREVRRVLADHGTLWLNLGDSYTHNTTTMPLNRGVVAAPGDAGKYGRDLGERHHTTKLKDLLGIPWMVAFALRADGWYLRSDIVWSKPNPVPESVTDRPTKAHEYVFLLSKSDRYYFDQEAVREPHTTVGALRERGTEPSQARAIGAPQQAGGYHKNGRNVRSVWEIATQPYPEAHFATFPEALVERCIKAGCPERVCGECGAPSVRVFERVPTGYDGARYGERAVSASGGAITGGTRRSTLGSSNGKLTAGTKTTGWTDCGHGAYQAGVVLDPFVGSGTTALVARKLGRRCVGIDLNAEYLDLAAKRTQQLSLLGGAA